MAGLLPTPSAAGVGGLQVSCSFAIDVILQIALPIYTVTSSFVKTWFNMRPC